MMYEFLRKNDIQIEPKKIEASLFIPSTGFGVSPSDDEDFFIRFDLLTDESHTLEFEASDHPIENGAVITDHVTQKLRSCTVSGMFTNSPLSGFEGETVEDYENAKTEKGTGTRTNSAIERFGRLEELAMQRKPVRLVTGLKVYPEMIITSLPVKVSTGDGEAVKFSITMREFKVAHLKKTAVFGKYQPKTMEASEDRIVANKGTNGKVSAKGVELVNAAISGTGVN